jgi:hypothetical protein
MILDSDGNPMTNEPPQEELIAILPRRQGHFRLGSGHHKALCLDLDSLFVRPTREAIHSGPGAVVGVSALILSFKRLQKVTCPQLMVQAL